MTFDLDLALMALERRTMNSPRTLIVLGAIALAARTRGSYEV